MGGGKTAEQGQYQGRVAAVCNYLSKCNISSGNTLPPLRTCQFRLMCNVSRLADHSFISLFYGYFLKILSPPKGLDFAIH